MFVCVVGGGSGSEWSEAKKWSAHKEVQVGTSATLILLLQKGVFEELEEY